MTNVLFEVGGATAVATIVDESETGGAFVASLPLEGVLEHSFWSGLTCEFALPLGAPEEEAGHTVLSLYPGSLAYDARRQRVMISYGNGESRTALGRSYVVRFGELGDGRASLLEALGRVHDQGKTPVRIRLHPAAAGPRS